MRSGTDLGGDEHVKGGQSDTNKSAQELTRELEGQKNCPSPCPTRGSNPGSSYFNSDSLTTELRPPVGDIISKGSMRATTVL